jgi:predicted AAA+ superfamily ATPase
MKGALVDIVTRKIRQAARLRHRLVVIATPFGGGKTHTLNTLAARTGAPLLDLPEKQGQQQLTRSLADTVSAVEGDLVLVDGGETLFDPVRLQQTLNSLWKAAKSKTVVLALQGTGRQSRVLLWKRQRTHRARRPD